MHHIRRICRLVGDLAKTLAVISIYLGVTGAIGLASLHVIATTAELKCEVCADPALILTSGPRLFAGVSRDEAPEAFPDTPLRGTLGAE